MRASTLALIVLASAAPALAQERTWDVAEHTVIDADHVVLDVPATSDGAPTRARIHGTLDSALDGAELDVLALRRAGAEDLSIGAPLVLAPGTVVIEANEVAHRYVLEAPPGTPIHATLAISRMASQRLVTATELRGSLRGAMEVEVLRRSPAALAVMAPAEASDLRGVAAGALAALLAAVAFVVLRRREPEEARLLRRARRARQAIAARARALGPALAGVVVPAERLEGAIRRAREHLARIDATLGATRWTEGDAARARVRELEQRRGMVRGDLERMTSELEAALVRLASLEAERHAEREVESVASRMRAEIDLAEDVEREVARL